jgi:hypothetical protein
LSTSCRLGGRATGAAGASVVAAGGDAAPASGGGGDAAVGALGTGGAAAGVAGGGTGAAGAGAGSVVISTRGRPGAAGAPLAAGPPGGEVADAQPATSDARRSQHPPRLGRIIARSPSIPG